MEKKGGLRALKKYLYRGILLTAVLGLMLLIFGFSSQSGETSGSISGEIAGPITRQLLKWMPDLHDGDEEALYMQVDHVVRKTAHFLEYALLGCLLCLLMRSFGISSAAIPVIIGILYAVTDELHQTFEPGRSGKITDVLLDAAGVGFGVMFVRLINHFRRKS